MKHHHPRVMSMGQIAALLLASLAAGTTHAGDAAAGKARAGMCATCHGPLGISQLPNAPHLAGQPEIYMIEQLKQYRSGKRANEVMAVIAKPMTDTEIEDLAAWYSSITIKVTEK
ncbi:MAG: cytochrome c [Burkholderiaceae bacterium]